MRSGVKATVQIRFESFSRFIREEPCFVGDQRFQWGKQVSIFRGVAPFWFSGRRLAEGRSMLWSEPEQTRFERLEKLLSRFFPPRQIVFRTDGELRHIVFSRRFQLSSLAALTLVLGWIAYSSISYVRHDAVIAGKDGEISQAHMAYRSLLLKAADYQKQVMAFAQDLKQNQIKRLKVEGRNTSLQRRLRTVRKKLTSTENERRQIVADREGLTKELGTIGTKVREMSNYNFALKDNLNSIESDLRIALTERNRAFIEGKKMQTKIAELNKRLLKIQTAEQESVQRLTDGALANIESMKKIVALTGLKVSKLLAADDSLFQGQGGPFIAAKPDSLPGDVLKANLINLDYHVKHSNALRTILRKMPLAAPLNSYYISSSYGKRRDPINKKWAAHYGLDMGSAMNTPVYATAPGVVVTAGWKGNFGKVVEIDHGAGIKTRYAHLNKILVKKGQRIDFRKKIALVGNTGRSTGAHLHYEIHFKGRTKNPAKFIKAGRYVFKE